MIRPMLALSLALAASGAFAAEPAPDEPDSGLCQKAEAEDNKQASGKVNEPSAGPGATAPVRPRSSGAAGRSTPRWNTLLPGMIR